MKKLCFTICLLLGYQAHAHAAAHDGRHKKRSKSTVTERVTFLEQTQKTQLEAFCNVAAYSATLGSHVQQLADSNYATALTTQTLCTIVTQLSERIDALERQQHWQALLEAASESSTNDALCEQQDAAYQIGHLASSHSENDTGYDSSSDESNAYSSNSSQKSRKRLRELAQDFPPLIRQNAAIGDDLEKQMGMQPAESKRQRTKK